MTFTFPDKACAVTCTWKTYLLLKRPLNSLFVPTSVTRKYHPKLLERLHLLQYFRSLAEYTALGVLSDTMPQSLRADFRSCLVARSRKPIKCVLKALLRRSTHVAPIRPQKANGSSCSSQQWHLRRRVCGCQYNHVNQISPHFFGEDHIGYWTTVRGPASCVMWFFRDMIHST